MIRIADVTLATRGFSRVQREFSVLAMSGVASHAGGKTSSPKTPAWEATNGEAARKTFRAGHYKDLTEAGNRARKVSGTQVTLTYLCKPICPQRILVSIYKSLMLHHLNYCSVVWGNIGAGLSQILSARIITGTCWDVR